MEVIVKTPSLKTKGERRGNKLRDKNLWDVIWVPEQKTGLLVKVTIVHRFHVPGKYTEEIKKHESNEDNIVWARHDMSNGHFQWFALYADSEAFEADDGVTDADKFLYQHHNRELYTEKDETSRE